MNEQLCDQIAEKIEQGESLWLPLRQIVGWMLNQNWLFPTIYAVDIDRDGDIVILYTPNGPTTFAGSQAQLTATILNLAHQYDLTHKERAYLLAKIPKKRQRSKPEKKETPETPAFKFTTNCLRVTNRDGTHTYYSREEEPGIKQFCRKNNLTLHKNIQGEWKQIIP